MSTPSGAPFQQPQSAAMDYTKLVFVFQQLLRGIATATVVQVVACSNDGDTSPVGTVDVLPLVNQVDGQGNPQPHGTIYGLPYTRLQGGANAVIIDPEPGDLGIAVFASRDLTAVKASKGQANPGSARVCDYADGLYIGGVLNGTPTRYVQMNSDGITVVDPSQITLQAPTINLKGAVKGTSTADFDGDVTAEGTSLHTHKHGQVQPGSGESGPPV